MKKVKPRNSSPIRIRGRGRSNNKPKGTMIFRLNHIIFFVPTGLTLDPTRVSHIMRISYGNFQLYFVSPAQPSPAQPSYCYGDFIWEFLMKICNGDFFMILSFSPNHKNRIWICWISWYNMIVMGISKCIGLKSICEID